MINLTIQAPRFDRQVSYHGYAVEFCSDLGKTATVGAALIQYFNYWYSVKLEKASRLMALNQDAISRGLPAPHQIDLLQFHTYEELQEDLLNIGSENTLRKAIKFLIEREVVSTHKNPSPRYKFDNTKFYLFHPEPLRVYISEVYVKSNSYLKVAGRRLKLADSYLKVEQPSLKVAGRDLKVAGTIPDTTTDTPSDTTTTYNSNSVASATKSEKKEDLEKKAAEKKKWDALRKKIGKKQTEVLQEIFSEPGFRLPFGEKFKRKFIEWLEYKRLSRSVYKSKRGITSRLNLFAQTDEEWACNRIDDAMGATWAGVIWAKDIKIYQNQKAKDGKFTNKKGGNSTLHEQAVEILTGDLDLSSAGVPKPAR